MEVQRHSTGCTISTVQAFKLLPLSDFGCIVMPMSVTCFVSVSTRRHREEALHCDDRCSWRRKSLERFFGQQPCVE